MTHIKLCLCRIDIKYFKDNTEVFVSSLHVTGWLSVCIVACRLIVTPLIF